MSHESDVTKIEDIANADAYKIGADFDVVIIPQEYPDSETPGGRIGVRKDRCQGYTIECGQARSHDPAGVNPAPEGWPATG